MKKLKNINTNLRLVFHTKKILRKVVRIFNVIVFLYDLRYFYLKKRRNGIGTFREKKISIEFIKT